MADDQNITIKQWPDKPLALNHDYQGKPVPLTLGFDAAPIHVRVADEDGPIKVAMAMQVAAERPLPLCISLCEPICARSVYRIDFSIFGNPFGTVVIQGLTRLFNCGDEKEAAKETPSASPASTGQP